LFSELSLDVGEFDNECVMGGLGDTMTFVGFFDSPLCRLEGILGDVELVLGRSEQRFYILWE